LIRRPWNGKNGFENLEVLFVFKGFMCVCVAFSLIFQWHIDIITWTISILIPVMPIGILLMKKIKCHLSNEGFGMHLIAQ
jgi:hypothetical protein